MYLARNFKILGTKYSQLKDFRVRRSDIHYHNYENKKVHFKTMPKPNNNTVNMNNNLLEHNKQIKKCKFIQNEVRKAIR